MPEKESGEGSAEASDHPPAGKRKAAYQDDEGRAPDQVAGRSPSGAVASEDQPIGLPPMEGSTRRIVSGGMQGPKVRSKFVDKTRSGQGAPAV